MGKLSSGLGAVDKKVAELKEQLTTYSREAAVLEINLSKVQDTVSAAQELVSKLEDEYQRWTTQVEPNTVPIPDLSLLILLFLNG